MRHLILIYISVFTCFGLVAQERKTVAVDSVNIKKIDSLTKIIENEFYKRNYDKSIEYGELALEISEKINYYNNIKHISSYLGSAYLEIDDTIRAKNTFNKSVLLSQSKNDTTWILASKIDLANFYAFK